MKMNFLKTFAVITSVCTLVGCGGGGGNAGTNVFAPAPSSGASGVTATAADLVVQLSKATLDNTGVDSVAVTITAVDANRVAVPGAAISVTADNQALFAANTGLTDSTGSLQASLRIGASRANRVVTITVRSGSITKTATVQVIGAALTATLAPTLVAPGGTGTVSFRLVDKVNTAMANESITIVAPGLTPANVTGTTGPNGDYDFNYAVPSTLAGTVTVSAIAGGASSSDILQIQSGSTTIPNAIATPVSASVSANPSVVGINQLNSTSNRSVIQARFLATGNAPISNIRVKFDLNGDSNSIGGTFSSGTALLYSDVNGLVTTSYIPAGRSSPTDGVTVRACYGISDAAAASCATSALTRLTVAAEPLGVSIGTNNEVIETELTYIKKYVISVVDSAGQAMAGVDVAASIDLQQYRKGFYVGPPWSKSVDFACIAEDADRNGSLGAGEDLNNNARLDPGKSDVSITLLQAKTRADGTAELQIQYAQSFATWIDAKITVSASGVAGTEGRASYLVTPLPAPAHAFTDTPAPAFVISPYGRIANCASAS